MLPFPGGARAGTGPAPPHTQEIVTVDQSQLKAIVDGLFQYIEQLEGNRPVIKKITEGLNAAVDAAGIPALEMFLKSKGIL